MIRIIKPVNFQVTFSGGYFIAESKEAGLVGIGINLEECFKQIDIDMNFTFKEYGLGDSKTMTQDAIDVKNYMLEHFEEVEA